ncbi:MAG: 6,7-dimethyl-8-ribityllumazine synthase [Flavitalea sp.]
MAEVSNSKLFQSDTGILPGNACIVIMRTEWNASIVDELERGCTITLNQQGVKDTKVFTVPGAFEIPFAIKKFWDINKYKDDRPSAFIALGCILRGDTPHFEYVCRAATDGILQLNLLLPIPTVFGILTVDTQEQADERIGGRHGHKGEEAAITALKMISIQHSFNQ